MTDKEIRALIERRRKDWRYGNSVEAKYKAEECDDILELIDSLQEEPVSEELEEASRNYADNEEYGDDMYFAIKAAFKGGAKWQKEKEYTCYEEAFEDGASWKKAEMIANAIETTVHIDAGGYPYIPQTELYDYDKAVEIAKEEMVEKVTNYLNSKLYDWVQISHFGRREYPDTIMKRDFIYDLKQAMKDE